MGLLLVVKWKKDNKRKNILGIASSRSITRREDDDVEEEEEEEGEKEAWSFM